MAFAFAGNMTKLSCSIQCPFIFLLQIKDGCNRQWILPSLLEGKSPRRADDSYLRTSRNWHNLSGSDAS